LYPTISDWNVILTVRQAHLPTHAGQVCFPGGRMEADETPEEAALREFTEEVGSPGIISFVGRLSPVYVYASNYSVIPCVAIAAEKPELHPQPDEVADVLGISLPNFRQTAKQATYKIQRGALQFTAPSYKVGARFLWGATWLMLGDLLDRIEAVGPLTGW
jgi:8-oxo-dGTP pyrophosphatase MutT (NUDIX family)